MAKPLGTGQNITKVDILGSRELKTEVGALVDPHAQFDLGQQVFVFESFGASNVDDRKVGGRAAPQAAFADSKPRYADSGLPSQVGWGLFRRLVGRCFRETPHDRQLGRFDLGRGILDHLGLKVVDKSNGDRSLGAAAAAEKKENEGSEHEITAAALPAGTNRSREQVRAGLQ